ncbi:COG1470 family protein [Hwangdonia lutea]|uniref:Uncharacterized protein n=1 Tax=Hwangdonia lutea TaxID=3075823 RepID=A0AA97ELD2_9FLAO|nr:hypothetical protein [Hwangdonia sp. SCSIO 19198]WOD42559.1 hypothetical protein RNZ46_11225 [Hwangdonia sp. SCSIO 19198]
MAETNNKQPLEALFKHTLELNKKYIEQGFKVFSAWSKQPNKPDNLFVFKPEQYSKAFNAFAKLNLEYYNNAMALGFGMLDTMLNKTPPETAPEAEPAFVLTGSVNAGSKTSLEFILENTKTEVAQCELVNSNFINENNIEFPSIKTSFKPQKFTQKPDESSTVKIGIQVPKNTPSDTYFSDVTVIGFEPSFFRIQLHVEKLLTKSAHAKTKRQSKK